LSDFALIKFIIVQIKAVVGITNNCGNVYKTVWNIYNTGGSLIEPPNTFDQIVTTYVSPANSREKGTYKYELETTFIEFTGTPKMTDFIFIKYEYQELVVTLAQNQDDFVAVKKVYTSSDIIIDSQHSVDPAAGLASVQSMASTRTWTCITGTAITEELALSYIGINNVEGLIASVATTSCANLLLPSASKFNFIS